MNKIVKTITIGYSADTFVVSKLTQSTEYLPGRYLSKKEVDALCASRDWKVTLIHSSKV